MLLFCFWVGGGRASGAFLRSETEEIRERANRTADAEALRGIGNLCPWFLLDCSEQSGADVVFAKCKRAITESGSEHKIQRD